MTAGLLNQSQGHMPGLDVEVDLTPSPAPAARREYVGRVLHRPPWIKSPKSPARHRTGRLMQIDLRRQGTPTGGMSHHLNRLGVMGAEGRTVASLNNDP